MTTFSPERPVDNWTAPCPELRFCCSVILLFLVLVLSQGCAFLPRSAPSAGRIIGSDSDLSHLVVRLDYETVTKQNDDTDLVFPESACAMEPLDPATIGVDDRMTVLIWEKTPKGLLSQEGGFSELGSIEVDRNGDIYVPFAGMIHAEGKYLDELREGIRARLKVKTLDPEVDVRAVERVSKRVAIQGAVTVPGTYVITGSTTRLLSLIAMAGGPVGAWDAMEVQIRRGDETLRSSLSLIQSEPSQNIALRPGDIVTVSELGPSVAVLGAARRQGLVQLPAVRRTLLDALTLAGGLDDGLANLKGVFLFRRGETPGLAGHANSSPTVWSKSPVIYHLDFRDPESVFLAGMFRVQDGDALVMSSASSSQLRKFFAIFTGAARSIPAIP